MRVLLSTRASNGLPPVANVRQHVVGEKRWPATAPVLGPWRPAGLDVVQTGAWILPDQRQLPRDPGAGRRAVVRRGWAELALTSDSDACFVVREITSRRCVAP